MEFELNWVQTSNQTDMSFQPVKSVSDNEQLTGDAGAFHCPRLLTDGASALAEAVLMAVRSHKSARRVLVPKALHPAYRATVRTIVSNQGIELV